ncbi:HNH endonuclease [Cyanobacterium sp. HL-69]|uniref:HNH endonuclease n=1 Tax=Cyanobacterium sp. HL-69 TaxID=2054282 RepID=UPI00406BAA5A
MAKQQNFTCPHCQQSLFNGESTEIHHIIPRALGGSDNTKNLVINTALLLPQSSTQSRCESNTET